MNILFSFNMLRTATCILLDGKKKVCCQYVTCNLLRNPQNMASNIWLPICVNKFAHPNNQKKSLTYQNMWSLNTSQRQGITCISKGYKVKPYFYDGLAAMQ